MEDSAGIGDVQILKESWISILVAFKVLVSGHVSNMAHFLEI